MALTDNSVVAPELPSTLRVAIVHDFLVSRGGAERVALALSRAFPGAPLHTALWAPHRTFSGFDPDLVRALPLNRISLLRNHHRASVPVIQQAFRRLRVDADVVICSSSGFSHMVETPGHKIVYCHTPARWLYDTDRYLQRFGKAASFAAKTLAGPAARRDTQAMLSADAVITNSTAIASEVTDVYAIPTSVVAPPSTLGIDHHSAPVPGLSSGFVLCPARALGYKRIDILLKAAATKPGLQFVHLGSGPDLARLKAEAPSNVRFLGEVDDATLVWCYRNAGCVAITSAEDFGLVPLEARAFGTPSVVPAARGFLDHVCDGINGVLYDLADVAQLGSAIDVALAMEIEPPTTDPLGVERFTREIRNAVLRVMK